MGRKNKLDKYRDALFEKKTKALTPVDREVLRRYESAFTIWLDDPLIPDVEIRNYLLDNFDINVAQAYRDINNIKTLLGNVRNAAKEWQRYKLIAMIDETYAMAKRKKDFKAMAMCIANLGRYTQLDKEDGEEMPWDDIIPQTFEPSSDPTLAGVKPIPNVDKKIDELLKKYNNEIEIEDAIVIEQSPEDLLQ